MVSSSRGAAAGLERLLTVREVAAVLGVATSTVYKLCDEGRIRHVRVSNTIRVQREALAAYLAGSGF